MLGLAVHAATLAERSVACSSLAITTELVHVVGIVGAAVVRVVIGVACAVSMLRMLALGTMSLTSHGCWVGGIMSAVLGVTVTALRLERLLVHDSRGTRTSALATVLTLSVSFATSAQSVSFT